LAHPHLHQYLFGLLEASPPQDRLAYDPLSGVVRYADPADREVAAVLCATLAFGRVAAFLPVMHAWLDLADVHGGPARWADRLWPVGPPAGLPPGHRWLRAPEIELLVAATGHLRAQGSLGARWQAGLGREVDQPGTALQAFILQFRESILAVARARGRAQFWEDLPQGLRASLPLPSEGSACKRWCMLLRWMVRPPGPYSLDLGMWPGDPAHLVIPLDTHVFGIASMLGLTRRKDASWKTAVEITAALRALHPPDPLIFDFPLAHLGISGACTRQPDPQVCPKCPLSPACPIGTQTAG
jgi:uncharacterized protein (TIGR02757 family)